MGTYSILRSEGIGWAFIGAWALKGKTIVIAHLTVSLKSIFFEIHTEIIHT